MSVVVRGMEMPENCLKCPMQFGGWCYAAPPEIDERVAPTVDEAVEKGKPEWCPLVDLGKHGKLIDADALEPDADYDDGEYWAYSVAQVCSAQAVIEAEGSNDT